MKLMAKKEFFYGGANRKIGDEFEASSADARILVCIGKAYQVQDTKKSSGRLQTTQMRAEEPAAPQTPTVPQEETQEEAPRKRREYRRRDMTAEE